MFTLARNFMASLIKNVHFRLEVRYIILWAPPHVQHPHQQLMTTEVFKSVGIEFKAITPYQVASNREECFVCLPFK